MLKYRIGIKVNDDSGRFYIDLPYGDEDLDSNLEPFEDAMKRIRIMFSTDKILSIYLTNQGRDRVEKTCYKSDDFTLRHVDYAPLPFPFKLFPIDLSLEDEEIFYQFREHITACKSRGES